MQSDDATEPLQWDVQEFKQSLQEWAAISSQMVDLLHASVESDGSRNWRPHCTQIVRVVRAFGDRCRSEADGFGRWRTDGLEPDDVFEQVREHGQRLVDWLQRMMAE